MLSVMSDDKRTRRSWAYIIRGNIFLKKNTVSAKWKIDKLHKIKNYGAIVEIVTRISTTKNYAQKNTIKTHTNPVYALLRLPTTKHRSLVKNLGHRLMCTFVLLIYVIDCRVLFLCVFSNIFYLLTRNYTI